MKLTVLKVLALLVFLAGLCTLAVAFNFAPVVEFSNQVLQNLQGDGVGFNWKYLIVGAILTLLGGYGFIPQLRDRHRSIKYSTDHGEVNIDVRRAEATLRQVISAMPEVKSVRVQVRPDKDLKRAVIHADAVVINQDDAPARHTFEMITELIEETATDVLGLEIKRPIQLKVTGTQLDAKAASQALHTRVTQRASTAPLWTTAGTASAATASALATTAVDETSGETASTAYDDLEDSSSLQYVPADDSPIEPLSSASLTGEDAEEEDVHSLPAPQPADLEPLEVSEPIAAPEPEESRNIFDSDRSLPPLNEEEELPAAEPVETPEFAPGSFEEQPGAQEEKKEEWS